MDFRDSPEDAAFRDEVRGWLADHLVAEYAGIPGGSFLVADEDDFKRRLKWEQELGRGGWIGMGWPVEYGGRGLTVMQQAIFHEEYSKASGPSRVGIFGDGLIGPTIAAMGTDAQKRRFLPPILNATELWCQGYSEPNAGSDLASVQTRAVLDGDEWVINGQKVWTTYGQYADWIFAVCRSDPQAPAHQGLTYLLVPMDQPGVTVRPLRTPAGGHEFNEVFFDDARTSADMVLGEVHGGWKTAMTTLGFERGTAFLGEVYRFKEETWRLVEAARKLGLAEDPVVRQALSDALIGVTIMGYSAQRMLTGLARTGMPGPESSISKLYWSHWHQRLTELSMRLLGPAGEIRPDGPGYVLDEMQDAFIGTRAGTIYAGSSQIQKNIIGERVLGLPREPR